MDFDRLYKKIFSEPRMVQELMTSFIPGDWVSELDFSTLERVSGSFVSRAFKASESDVIWRLHWKNHGLLYVYVLLEVQTQSDPFMAVRMMNYLSGLYLTLSKQKPYKQTQALPPVLPLVLYRGKPKWKAAQDVSRLIEKAPEALKKYMPRLRYFLIEEWQTPDELLEKLSNAVTLLFALEKDWIPEALPQLARQLLHLSQKTGQELPLDSFLALIRVLMQHRFPGISTPDFTAVEIADMPRAVEKTYTDWSKKYRQEGWQEGRQEGIQEGIERGVHSGLHQGLQKGKMAMVARLLRNKFGSLEQSVLAHLEKASPREIELLGDRILTSATLNEVFQSKPARVRKKSA